MKKWKYMKRYNSKWGNSPKDKGGPYWWKDGKMEGQSLNMALTYLEGSHYGAINALVRKSELIQVVGTKKGREKKKYK